jgi:DNA-binding transcriptional LysR family regulator
MTTLPFTLRQLDIFASLAETCSFRRTAEILGISQVSVSNQLKTLEGQLGIPLLLRNPGRRPELTADGHAFLHDLASFQIAADRLARHRRRELTETEQVRYRILIGQGLSDHYVRPKLDGFLASHPHISLDFTLQLPSSQQIAMLSEGSYDFALFHLREDQVLSPGLEPLALLRGGVYGDRRFADGRALPLTAEEVAQLPFILPLAAREHDVRRSLAAHGIRPSNVIGHIQHYDVIVSMLGRGLAVSTFTDAMIPPQLRARVTMLYQLENWRLVWFRRATAYPDSRRDAVEAFLKGSVLDDETFPTLEAESARRSRTPTEGN